MHRLDLIIPKPIEMTPGEGTFRWTRQSTCLTDGESEENRFAVDLWVSACAERGLAGPRLTSDVATCAGAAIIIGQRDRLPITRDLLDSTTHPVPEYLGTEGYFLEISPDRVFLVADTSTGLFYGVQTLIMLLPGERSESLPCVRIVDIPTVPIRGYMEDFGRGQTPTLATLKRTVERLAALKFNAFFPYFEDGFHFKSHPAIGRNRDRIEPEEAAELVEYARRFHVRIIPIHETVAHMEAILAQPEYRHLREGDSERTRTTLNLAHPEALKLMENTIRDLCEVFPDPLFFVATDECLHLGTDRSKREADLIGQGGLFTGHLKRLREILLKYNKRMIISPDPIQPEFFKPFGLENFPREYLMRMPRDIVFAPWHYSRMDSYPFGEFLRDHNIDQILWGSTSDAGNLFPSVSRAAENAATFMPFAHRFGALGGVVSQWDGAPGDSTFVEYNWPLFAYFAEALWNPEPRPFQEFLPLCFEQLTGSAEAAKLDAVYLLLGDTDPYLPWGGGYLESSSHRQFYRPMEPHRLEQDHLEKIRQLRTKIDEARGVYADAAPTARRYHDVIESFSFTLDQVELLTHLVEARHELAIAGNLPPTTKDRLIQRLNALKSAFGKQWKSGYKTRILPRNLERFDRLIESISAAASQ